MNTPKKLIKDIDLQKVEPALNRAVQRARELALKTNTPLVIYKNGKIIHLNMRSIKWRMSNFIIHYYHRLFGCRAEEKDGYK